jgi:glyoxylase-like metal-dependent hydrolase (beta-lactamase superfamily II)
MNPVSDFLRLTDDLFVWHGFDPECKVDCSSTAVRTKEGFVLVDPVRIEEQALARMVGDTKVAAVLLTNGNHWRGASDEKERLDVPVYAPEGARSEVQADHWVKDGDLLFGTLRAKALPGAGPGEMAYGMPGVLILGDALVNLDGLAILPDMYCENPQQLRASIKILPALDFEIVCFAHGPPLVGGRAAIAARVG